MISLSAKSLIAVYEGPLRSRVEAFKLQKGRPPCLGVVLVGEDPASQVYVRGKAAKSAAYGFASKVIRLAANTSQTDLEEQIQALNKDAAVDAYLVQLPVPPHINSQRITELISPEKDADGFTFEILGRLFAGKGQIKPCTPAGIIRLLEHYKVTLSGAEVVVVGRSLIVGNSVAQLLLQKDATVTICHSKTADLQKHLQRADVVIVAAGKKHLFKAADFKKGAFVIDVGIHGSGAGGSLAGDVDPTGAEGHLGGLTPVPGGVGPMTIFCLLENALTLAEQSLGKSNG